MAQARICDRCGATFPLTETFYNRVRLYHDDPEMAMQRGERSTDCKDVEICHNCAEDLMDFLQKVVK